MGLPHITHSVPHSGEVPCLHAHCLYRSTNVTYHCVVPIHSGFTDITSVRQLEHGLSWVYFGSTHCDTIAVVVALLATKDDYLVSQLLGGSR